MSPEGVGPEDGPERERCAETRERLDDYSAGALTGAERDRVETHLATCGGCRAEAEAWAALLAEARSLPRTIAPPRDLWAGIDARIEGPPVPTATRAARPSLPRWALAAAALALVVLSAAVSSLLTRRWDEAMALKTRGGEIARPDATLPADEARYLAASRELLSSTSHRTNATRCSSDSVSSAALNSCTSSC